MPIVVDLEEAVVRVDNSGLEEVNVVDSEATDFEPKVVVCNLDGA